MGDFIMIDINKGRYWDEGITLVSSCTKCSPGCDHCWALAMEQRFKPEFKNQVQCHPERLKRFNTRKPKVFAVWNDLFHEAVPDEFIHDVYWKMYREPQNTYLILTKRPQRMLEYKQSPHRPLPNKIWHGLTVCNQQEADEKIPIFLRVPGKKFLSIEPMLAPINIQLELLQMGNLGEDGRGHRMASDNIDAVLLGGETGPGARPMQIEWVRSIRDQCQGANVPFFFKGWGKWGVNWMNDDNGMIAGSEWMDKGIKKSGRVLDGRTHDDLPWVK
jgi:protein gp37